jgi:hypothetical protein
MKKNTLSILLSLSILVFACTETEKKDSIDDKEVESLEDLSFEDQLIREITGKLQIPSTEKFDYKVYWENLNPDDEKDAIITVNRLEYAKERATQSPNPAKLAEMGYIGNYNYFFFYDGKKQRFSRPIAVPSSPMKELKVIFKNIQANSLFKDLIIEYRIQNSAWHTYYMLEGDMMNQVFQWKVYDKIGTSEAEANYFELDEGRLSLTKDISIYKGKITNVYDKNESIYDFEPAIEKTSVLSYRFFYEPNARKYMTENK